MPVPPVCSPVLCRVVPLQARFEPDRLVLFMKAPLGGQMAELFIFPVGAWPWDTGYSFLVSSSTVK